MASKYHRTKFVEKYAALQARIIEVANRKKGRELNVVHEAKVQSSLDLAKLRIKTRDKKQSTSFD